MIRKSAALASCLAFLAAGAAAQPRRFAIDDLAKIVRVADPQIAPDGRSIVVVVSRNV